MYLSVTIFRSLFDSEICVLLRVLNPKISSKFFRYIRENEH